MNSRSFLEMVSPGLNPRRIALAPRIELGRESGDVIVADPAVSRRHLLLELTEEAWYASDLGSSNGTTVNGHRIGGRTMLSAGDEIRIGDTRITVGDAPVPSTPSMPTLAVLASWPPPQPPVSPTQPTRPDAPSEPSPPSKPFDPTATSGTAPARGRPRAT